MQRSVSACESVAVVDFPMVVIHKDDNKIITVDGDNGRSDVTQDSYEIGYWCDVDGQRKGYICVGVGHLQWCLALYFYGLKSIESCDQWVRYFLNL